jgi:hypothetical protein
MALSIHSSLQGKDKLDSEDEDIIKLHSTPSKFIVLQTFLSLQASK